MTSEEARAIRDAAATLADRLNADINSAMTRNEHIRLSARANEAANLVYALDLVLSMSASDPELTPRP